MFWSAICKSKARLDGKTVVITGANTGIGKETALDLYKRGGCIIIACRDTTRAKHAIDDIKKETKNLSNVGSISSVTLELDSLDSVRECAKKLLDENSQINILINNAGIMACPKSTTKDGFEMQFGVNHLGHFLFTCLLLPKMKESTPARIVNVSSVAHWYGKINFDDLMNDKSYSPRMTYCQSKLANVLFTKELAARLHGTGVNVYSLHPGVIATELPRHLSDTYIPGLTWISLNIVSYFIKTPKQGAQTTIYCSVDENCANESGLYYSECREARSSQTTKNLKVAKKLWDVSVELVGLKDNF